MVFQNYIYLAKQAEFYLFQLAIIKLSTNHIPIHIHIPQVMANITA